MTVTKVYAEPYICEKEILRYAGCKSSIKESLHFSVAQPSQQEVEKMLKECIEEARPRLSYKVCYIELPLSITDDVCDFGCMKVQSKDLVKNLQGCEKVILFGATIGVEIDRLIVKYSHISPSKALMFQAIGAERIEALCDVFCEDIEKELRNENAMELQRPASLRPRFSPGYGDLPLEIQRQIFGILNCGKSIGLSLNESLLMSPSKSVTAFVGVAESQNITNSEKSKDGLQEKGNDSCKCAACTKIDCEFRER